MLFNMFVIQNIVKMSATKKNVNSKSYFNGEIGEGSIQEKRLNAKSRKQVDFGRT